MAMYVGVNGTPKEISSLYVGVNGVPKEVNEVYVGDGGSMKLVGSVKVDPGESIFTSSGIFTVPKGVKEIEVFVVGGGSCTTGSDVGGSGGFTNSQFMKVSNGENIEVSVGAGAVGGFGTINTTGGDSAIVSNNYSVVANGGVWESTGDCIKQGGSGGGAGNNWGGAGGSDGSNGNYGRKTYDGVDTGVGKGQGTTTRAFGESEGTLYAGGGGGMGGGWASDYGRPGSGGAGGGGRGGQTYFNPYIGDSGYWVWACGATSGGTNTGGGSGAGGCGSTGRPNGGSGIAIIRWGY